MANVPNDRKYTVEHEWTKWDGDNVVIGITEFAAGELGDVVFLDLPKVGRAIIAGKPFGAVESTKSVSDLYAPIDGEVIAINSAAVDKPELVNKDPHGEAWMIKVRPADKGSVDKLLDAAAYEAHLKSIAK